MKICSYNLENMYIGIERLNESDDLAEMTEAKWASLSTSFTLKNKLLFKIVNTAKVILDIDADIYCLQEVMGKESLNNFNKLFLESKYELVLLEETSDRPIFVGFLIKKGIEYKIHSFSNKKLKNGYLASRNLNGLEIQKNGVSQFFIIGTHLKSKRTDAKKTNTYNIREMEVELLGRLHDEIREKNDCPILIMGDFNANFNLEPEFSHLNKRDYFDFITVKHPDNHESIGTFTANYVEGKISRLDFIIIEKKYKNIIALDESYIYDYRNEYGDNISLPFSKYEKKWIGSDHCPIIIKLKL
jgi:endonuclease/exonuclease/phosphatase family metal-dependent hydrolase